MAPARCSTLRRTTSQRTTGWLRQEQASTTQRYTTSPTIAHETIRPSSAPQPSSRSTDALTLCTVAMRAIDSSGMEPPGGQRRTSTLIRLGPPIAITLISPSPSTSQSWRWQMAAWRGKSRSLTSQISEQRSSNSKSLEVGFPVSMFQICKSLAKPLAPPNPKAWKLQQVTN